MVKKIEQDRIDKALKLYAQGVSGKDAAQKFGFSESVILRHARKIGLPDNSRRLDPEIGIKAERFYKQGYLLHQIAKDLGISHTSIIRLLSKRGLLINSTADKKTIFKSSKWLCRRCDKVLPITLFKQESSVCRTCTYERLRDVRLLSPARYAAYSKKNKNKTLEYIKELKNRPCTDCNKTFVHVAMDFDHLDRSQKTHAISGLYARHASKEKIDAEVAKCELVCAVCHRIREFNRQIRPQLPPATQALQNQREKRAEGLEYITKIKEISGCQDCAIKGPGYIYDFDHLPGSTKVTHVGKLINCSKKRIDAEIAKCEVVCANCHRIRTHERLNRAGPYIHRGRHRHKSPDRLN